MTAARSPTSTPCPAHARPPDRRLRLCRALRRARPRRRRPRRHPPLPPRAGGRRGLARLRPRGPAPVASLRRRARPPRLRPRPWPLPRRRGRRPGRLPAPQPRRLALACSTPPDPARVDLPLQPRGLRRRPPRRDPARDRPPGARLALRQDESRGGGRLFSRSEAPLCAPPASTAAPPARPTTSGPASSPTIAPAAPSRPAQRPRSTAHDLAAAVLALLEAPDAAGPYNASDLLLDRADLLAAVAARTG